MDLFEVVYPGLWLGGHAIVAASSEAEALELVKAKTNCNLEAATVRNVSSPGPAVIYIDDGDY